MIIAEQVYKYNIVFDKLHVEYDILYVLQIKIYCCSKSAIMANDNLVSSDWSQGSVERVSLAGAKAHMWGQP